MDIHIVAEHETDQATIDGLIDTVPKVFPNGIDIRLIDSGVRYAHKTNRVVQLSEIGGEDMGSIDAVENNGILFYNLFPLVQKLQETKDRPYLVLTHQNFMCSAVTYVTTL